MHRSISSKFVTGNRRPRNRVSRLIDNRQFRLAPMWPEWNETDVNTESWDTGNVKKKDTTAVRNRIDIKTNVSTSPVVVDADLGIQSFDLVKPNQHLHHSEIMRRIISEITALWDICRKERYKNTNITSDNTNESNRIERTWRPWEHIYALNKVSKQSFITPYNPSGKYVVRLFFLGTWRKIIIDDTIPFDSENRCLLPQTSLPHELWPMLLSKALLKIISLDFNASNGVLESSDASVIHSLTGWVPEFIPLKYTHAEKIWNFLRYDRSNQYVSGNASEVNKNMSSFGPVPLFKWPDLKVHLPGERVLINDSSDHSNGKKLNKTESSNHLHIPKDSLVVKTPSHKENRSNASSNVSISRDAKRLSMCGRGTTADDSALSFDDPMISDAPKLIVFGTIPHSQPALISSHRETADRSERLRRYNLNDTFSTSMLLTSIRDIPLEPPSSLEHVPSWKLIRPKKPKVLPHAEPIVPHESKPERWIEITSPYINYPTASALNIKPTIRSHPIIDNIGTLNISSRLNRSVKHLIVPDHSNITEIDEEEDTEHGKLKLESNIELVQNNRNLSFSLTKQDSTVNIIHENPDGSLRNLESKSKIETPIDRVKTPRKSAVSGTKISSDTVSMKSKGGESDQLTSRIDAPTIGNSAEQQSVRLPSRKSIKKTYITPKIWMDFDDFCACFTSIIVFHNPHGYRYREKYTELKFVPYQQPVGNVVKEKKKEPNQSVLQQIPNLQDDRSSLYLFVDSTRETQNKNIELIVSLTSLSRWYDAALHENIVLNEKIPRGTTTTTEKVFIDANLAKKTVSQKEIIPQVGSLIAEIHSWKSVVMGQPILRLRTTATKAALLTVPPGRHVIKFTNTSPLAFNLQLLSDTNDFMLVDEDQLLNKITSVPENINFIIRAEELFLALDDSIENFHLVDQKENKLYNLFSSYCEQAPKSIELSIQTCFTVFNQALYSTLRSTIAASGPGINVHTQFAWRCFTNDLLTPDILTAYEVKRPIVRSPSRQSARIIGSSSVPTGTNIANKKTIGSRDKNSDDKTTLKQQPPSTSDRQEESSSSLLTQELSEHEMISIVNIQKSIRGFLQRRIALARMPGTEKNLRIQQILRSSMSSLKADQKKSSLLLFRTFLSMKPELVQCFSFRNDDWNMITYRDYNGIYQEQPANHWFVLLRQIFYFNEDSLIAAKFLSHLPNTLLRVINNDTYDEMPLVFNKLRPGVFTKNKNGYTFFAEGISLEQSILSDRFRLRLISSYTVLPEANNDQIKSLFTTKELIDYYVPNREQVLCRYRVNITDNINQTGLNFHLASIQFTASKSDVLMRLTVLDNNEEIVSVEGKGCLVLPAVLFMRTITNVVLSQSSSRPPSKLSTGTRNKKDVNNNYQDKDGTTNVMRRTSNSQIGLPIVDEDDKNHKYIVQVTVLRKSWPLTENQWRFVDQLEEQERNEMKVFNRQSSPIKIDRSVSSSPNKRRTGQTNSNVATTTTTTNKTKTSTGASGRSITSPSSCAKSSKENIEKTIDRTKPHWILRIISDADKADELIIRKDTERKEKLMNMKKAWETLHAGRAENAMESRQRFLDSLQTKIYESSLSEITDDTTNVSEIRTDEETNCIITSSAIESQQVIKQTPATKKNVSPTKKGSAKDEISKQTELAESFTSSASQANEALLDEPPPSIKCKVALPPLDLTPFLKQKLRSDGSIVTYDLFEKEDLQIRQNNFTEYSKHMDEIRQSRQVDQSNRYKEKIRQLEDYVDLQAKTDHIRRTMNEPREAFRQRFLEIEQTRLQELAAREQQLIDEEKALVAAMAKPVKKKILTGKKKNH
ncbi:unnamed protein product [Rotaria magnacalcarata]|uniref:Calpain catalytic domain-containing protein n=2 Tax=Rotaria magnacalcarata TaxID=392030 RepID=A0A816W646_9BILA|nr:unnamed protein product [Rotaria magnacalcarata]